MQSNRIYINAGAFAMAAEYASSTSFGTSKD